MSAWDRFLRDLLEQWPLIWAGLGQTVILAAVISVTGLLAGILVFYLSISRSPWVRRVTQAYISFFIGMPLIVLLFLMYYGLPQWGVRVTPFWIAVVGFTLNIAAYNAGYMGTAYNGLDPAELEAGRAQGRLFGDRFAHLGQYLGPEAANGPALVSGQYRTGLHRRTRHGVEVERDE